MTSPSKPWGEGEGEAYDARAEGSRDAKPRSPSSQAPSRPGAWIELHPDYCRERLPELLELPGVWVLTGEFKLSQFARAEKREVDMLSGRLRTTREDGSTTIEMFYPHPASKEVK